MRKVFLFAMIIISVNSALPSFTRGVYLLLADNTAKVKNDQGQEVPSIGVWAPRVGNWIQQFNVVFFTFINSDLLVPPSFEYARLNGNFAYGTKIIYAIGGQAYSADSKFRELFSTPEKAKTVASYVANWKCDGIDFDIEDPVGNDQTLGQNLVVFAQELRRLRPDFILTQPVYGYPQVYSESYMTIKSWDVSGASSNLADSIGIMVYQGVTSLQYLSNYDGTGCTQYWCALCDSAKLSNPCSSVPVKKILAGLGGDASTADIGTVCQYSKNGQKIGGYMVWFASADNGFQYAGGNADARTHSSQWMCGNEDNY